MYIIRILKFNAVCMPPDVMCESFMQACGSNLILTSDLREGPLRFENQVLGGLAAYEGASERGNRGENILQNDTMHDEPNLNRDDIRKRKTLQAELLRYLVRHIRQKNNHIVSLFRSISEHEAAHTQPETSVAMG